MADLGWIVPEEVLFQTLTAAQADVEAHVTANTIADYVATVFFNLTAQQQADLVTWFSTEDVKLIHGYPVFEHKQFPCIAIIIDPEETSQQYVGRTSGDMVLSTGETVRVEAARWRSNVALACHAENVDLARWLYHWVKWVLNDQDVVLSQSFPHLRQASGRDLRPTQIGESGRFIFGRALNYLVEYDQLHVKQFTSFELPEVGLDPTDGIDGTYVSGIGS